MKASASGHVQHLVHTALAQHVNEKIALALGTGFPVDELVPLFHKALDVLGLIFLGAANGKRILAVVLLDRAVSCRRFHCVPGLRAVLCGAVARLQGPDTLNTTSEPNGAGSRSICGLPSTGGCMSVHGVQACAYAVHLVLTRVRKGRRYVQWRARMPSQGAGFRPHALVYGCGACEPQCFRFAMETRRTVATCPHQTKHRGAA